MRAVVMFSGGRGSWAAAKRAVERWGADQVQLLFADTLVEDEDTYRFVKEAAKNIGAQLHTVSDGRKPFEVFRDSRWLGNTRAAQCSVDLKVKPCREWLAEFASEDVVLVVGIGWDETHRLQKIEQSWAPHQVWAPLTEAPYLSGDDVLQWMSSEGLEPPKAYADGFPHANCLAQGCVKGGQAYWKTIYEKRPEAFAYAEEQEQGMRDYLDADVAILRDRRGGITRPLPLVELRQRIEGREQALDLFEWGGCGCFTDESDGA